MLFVDGAGDQTIRQRGRDAPLNQQVVEEGARLVVQLGSEGGRRFGWRWRVVQIDIDVGAGGTGAEVQNLEEFRVAWVRRENDAFAVYVSRNTVLAMWPSIPLARERIT
jgi:hypothetical protein